jgi:hypothetical protein
VDAGDLSGSDRLERVQASLAGAAVVAAHVSESLKSKKVLVARTEANEVCEPSGWRC